MIGIEFKLKRNSYKPEVKGSGDLLEDLEREVPQMLEALDLFGENCADRLTSKRQSKHCYTIEILFTISLFKTARNMYDEFMDTSGLRMSKKKKEISKKFQALYRMSINSNLNTIKLLNFRQIETQGHIEAQGKSHFYRRKMVY